MTRATVGVLSGNRFSGGRRMGARSFFLKLEAEALVSNIGKLALPGPRPPRVMPRFRRVSLLSALGSDFGEFLSSCGR